MRRPIQSFDELNTSLLSAVPKFRSEYERHVDFYGEPLMTVLYGELYDFMQSELKSGKLEDSKRILRNLFDYVERGVASPDISINARVVTGFLEMITPKDPYLSELAHYMLPNTRAEWEAYHNAKLPDG